MNKKAVILAAGMGTRLRPLTIETHKCLTEVQGVSIIKNALSCLNHIGMEETVIVVGYLAEKVKTAVGNKCGRMKVTYIENSLFATTNTAYSLMLGLEQIDGYDTAYILEGDVFFEEAILMKLCESDYENETVLEPYNSTLDGTFVEIDRQHFVTDWIHKSSRSENFVLENKYKTVNLHKFSNAFIHRILLPMLKRTNEAASGNAPLEMTMRSIVNENPRSIYGMDTGGLKWVEIDDVNDLRLAHEIFGDD